MAETTTPNLVNGTDATVMSAGTSDTVVPNKATTSAGRTTQARTTVLPSFNAGAPVHHERDRYLLREVLGRGGMGEVVLCRDEDIDRDVALKYLHPELAGDAGIARFVEEIRTVGKLEHPNIVPIHDVGLDQQGRYFFVMKRLDGETLENIIEKLRARDPDYVARFSFERRAELVISILNALAFAHAHGIVHRDVKPANVMIGKHGEVVLMDWGVAKMFGARDATAPNAPASARPVETLAGSIIGTPMYMAPEQADGRHDAEDARTDLYSVSVLLHELMTLEHYLSDRTEMADVLAGVKTRKVSHRPKDYTKYPTVPMGYLMVCEHGMQKDQAQRYQTAAEMVEGLESARDGMNAVVCHVTATRRMLGELSRFVDRHPSLTWTLAPLVALSLVGSLGFTVFELVSMALR